MNAANEHGNTPLHYSCFFNHKHIAAELVNRGALVMQCNRYFKEGEGVIGCLGFLSWVVRFLKISVIIYQITMSILDEPLLSSPDAKIISPQPIDAQRLNFL